ncbi:MAG: hypothetical protein ACR2KQ_08390 [Actinomycetota bacterium]
MQDLRAIEDTVLPNSEGRETRLGDTWESGARIVVWLRHYA